MSNGEDADLYLRKALESIAGARSECTNGRFNTCANRAYYACYQAAIAALLREGIRSKRGRWAHTFVQAEFSDRLVNRRHLHPATLRGTLSWLITLRHSADYAPATISWADANRALRRANEFIAAVQRKGE
jgi:uncharacterized protein (UPF0332 family)